MKTFSHGGATVVLSPQATEDDLKQAAGEAQASFHEDCEGPGKCHGSMSWCNVCGNVRHTCDESICDTHPGTVCMHCSHPMRPEDDECDGCQRDRAIVVYP